MSSLSNIQASVPGPRFGSMSISSSIFSSIRMSRRQKLSGAANRKLKPTREREKENVLHLYMFSYRKTYVAKAKCKDKDAKCSLELEGEKHGENPNMVETNLEIKVEEGFPAGINVVKD